MRRDGEVDDSLAYIVRESEKSREAVVGGLKFFGGEKGVDVLSDLNEMLWCEGIE
jgi:hypothetical protein